MQLTSYIPSRYPVLNANTTLRPFGKRLYLNVRITLLIIINNSVCCHQPALAAIARCSACRLPNQQLTTHAWRVTPPITPHLVSPAALTRPLRANLTNRHHLIASINTWKRKEYIKLTTSRPLKSKKMTPTQKTLTTQARALRRCWLISSG